MCLNLSRFSSVPQTDYQIRFHWLWSTRARASPGRAGVSSPNRHQFYLMVRKSSWNKRKQPMFSSAFSHLFLAPGCTALLRYLQKARVVVFILCLMCLFNVYLMCIFNVYLLCVFIVLCILFYQSLPLGFL